MKRPPKRTLFYFGIVQPVCRHAGWEIARPDDPVERGKLTLGRITKQWEALQS